MGWGGLTLPSKSSADVGPRLMSVPFLDHGIGFWPFLCYTTRGDQADFFPSGPNRLVAIAYVFKDKT